MTHQTGRQTHQAVSTDEDGRPGSMAERARVLPLRPVDPPAPTTGPVPVHAGTGPVTTSPPILAWVLRHATHDNEAGKLPPGFTRWLHSLIAETSDSVAGNGHRSPDDPMMGLSDRHALAEVAQEFGLAKRTLRHLCQTGQIDGWQAAPGCKWWVDVESLREHLNRRGR